MFHLARVSFFHIRRFVISFVELTGGEKPAKGWLSRILSTRLVEKKCFLKEFRLEGGRQDEK
jgi:hypothetical protein